MILKFQRIELIIRMVATFEQFLVTSHKVKHLFPGTVVHERNFHAMVGVMGHHKCLAGQSQSHLGHAQNEQMGGRTRTVGQILSFILVVQRHQHFTAFKIRQ